MQRRTASCSMRPMFRRRRWRCCSVIVLVPVVAMCATTYMSPSCCDHHYSDQKCKSNCPTTATIPSPTVTVGSCRGGRCRRVGSAWAVLLPQVLIIWQELAQRVDQLLAAQQQRDERAEAPTRQRHWFRTGRFYAGESKA